MITTKVGEPVPEKLPVEPINARVYYDLNWPRLQQVLPEEDGSSRRRMILDMHHLAMDKFGPRAVADAWRDYCQEHGLDQRNGLPFTKT